jgi:hypothetical protein
MALGHMATHVTTKGARARDMGAAAQILCKSGFNTILGFFQLICLLLVDFLHFWGILGIFGGQILGGSWGCETNSIVI